MCKPEGRGRGGGLSRKIGVQNNVICNFMELDFFGGGGWGELLEPQNVVS